MESIDINKELSRKGLKVTIQRLAVYEALCSEKDHPTAEKLISRVNKKYPTISAGTVYKTLDTFVEHNIIKRVKTDSDIMRYDNVLEKHHHLYCAESDKIEDYFNEELNQILSNYFEKKKISGFKLEDFKLQLSGKFTK